MLLVSKPYYGRLDAVKYINQYIKLGEPLRNIIFNFWSEVVLKSGGSKFNY